MVDYNSNIIQITRTDDLFLLRKAIVANALSIENITVSNAPEKFKDLLGPTKGSWDIYRPFKITTTNGRIITQGISSCGLICSSLWRRMNIDFDPIYKPYVFGTAISREISFAKNMLPRSVFQTPQDFIKPQPGDYVVIGENFSLHVFTCIGWKDDTIISIDGGQTDKNGLQAIYRRERKYEVKNNVTYIGDRKLIGYIIFDMLPFRNTIINVPEGWEDIDFEL